jgi:hypothetical protein
MAALLSLADRVNAKYLGYELIVTDAYVDVTGVGTYGSLSRARKAIREHRKSRSRSHSQQERATGSNRSGGAVASTSPSTTSLSRRSRGTTTFAS